MIRKITANDTPLALSAGQSLTDTAWQSYADPAAYNQEGGKLALAITGHRTNGNVQPAVGNHGAKPTYFFDVAYIVAFPFEIHHGMHRFTMPFGVRCLYYQADFLVGTPYVSQEVVIKLNAGGAEQQLVKFYPSSAHVDFISPQTGEEMNLEPTGDNLYQLADNTLTLGVLTGEMDPKLWAQPNGVREGSLIVQFTYVTQSGVASSLMDFLTSSDFDGLDSLGLTFYPDCTREDY